MHSGQSSIMIRHAKRTDFPKIVAIYNQNVLTKQATADLQPVSVADRQAWFDAHSMAQQRPLLVAVDNKETVLGWASLSDLYERPAYHISAEVSVYIDEAAKGQGLGQRLTQALLALAPQCGLRQVVAKIFAHNQASIAMFIKLGFAEWGILRQVCDMDGFIADVVILGKSV